MCELDVLIENVKYEAENAAGKEILVVVQSGHTWLAKKKKK